MADPPETTGRYETGEQPPLRLVSEHELDRLRAREAYLTETVEDLEDENQLLRVEIAALERKLEQKDSQRQQVIDSYERILAERDRKRGDNGTEAETDRPGFGSGLLGRLVSELDRWFRKQP